ncbi:MmgE/PrpD family protein [Chloroflexota bacterium]
MNTTEEFAKFIVDTKLEAMPKPVVERAKELTLDAIGAAIFGARMPVTTLLAQYYRRRRGGTGEVTTFGQDFMLPIEDAVLINGTSLHSTELEAVPMTGEQQPAFTTFASLAAAELLGLSGKAVLEGFILGFELHGRLSANLHGIPARGGWGCVTGTLGAAAAAAKTMGFNVEQTRMTLGLASSQAGGLIEHAGTMTHYAELGLSINHGIIAALWIKEGVTAMQDVIENKKGFCRFYGVDGYDLEEITRGLGEGSFYITDPGAYIKKYPCCFRTHRALDSVDTLVRENNLTYDDIAEIKVDENLYDRSLLKYSEPTTTSEGRFSMEHCLAAMLVDGKVDENTFSDQKIGALKEARRKINVIVHEEWPPERGKSRTPVDIKLNNGKVFSKELKEPINPPREQIIASYKERAKTVLSESNVDRSAQMMLELEKVDKISELTRLLRP